MPSQLTTQKELPTQAVFANLPVMGKIGLRFWATGIEARQTGIDGRDQMLLRTAT
ncbi:hypothetical protein D3C76_1258980 [compost metagenome]